MRLNVAKLGELSGMTSVNLVISMPGKLKSTLFAAADCFSFVQ